MQKCVLSATKIKNGLPNLPEALQSCRTAKKIHCLLFVFLGITKCCNYENVIKSFTYIDDGISLNVIHVGVAKAQLSAPSLSGADDSCGNCVLEGKGAANSDHKLPRSQV